MAARLPKPRKPAEQPRRRNRPEEWTVLPADGCSLPAPPWPFGKAAKSEADRWKRLWALPSQLLVVSHEQARFVLRFYELGAAAVRWKLMGENPAKAVPNLQPKRPEIRPFDSWEEVESIAEELGQTLKALHPEIEELQLLSDGESRAV